MKRYLLAPLLILSIILTGSLFMAADREPKTHFISVPKNLAAVSEKQRLSFEQEVINLLNQERSKRGLAPLETDSELQRLTRLKSEDMRNNNYFSTSSPSYGTLTDMLNNNGYQYRFAAEKIAGGNKTPLEVFNNWLKNPEFMETILREDLTHIGVGYADGKGEYLYYWTMWLIERPAPITSENKLYYEQEVLKLVNVERAQRGLNTLKWDPELARVAKVKSEDMRDKDYFAHQSPTYGDLGEMLKHFKVSFNSAAENIAAGQKTPQEVVTGWMNSEGHRKNILDSKLTHLGVGYADGGGSYYIYWTQLFRTKP